ncbi:MAG: hypothetical protein ACJ8GN_14695 [Longimicrobiaceae bacterium]
MFRIKALGLATSALLLSVGCAGAQAGRAPVRLETPGWSADSLLTWFESEAIDPTQRAAGVGMARVLYVLTHPVPASKQDSVADGLERLALRPNALEAAKMAAVSYLAVAGASSVSRPLPTSAARLGRVFRASRDRGVRTSVLMLSWTLADRGGMIPLLREVATAAPDNTRAQSIDDDSDPAALAIGALSRMGEPGRAVLIELHQKKLVRSPRAQVELRMVIERSPAQFN